MKTFDDYLRQFDYDSRRGMKIQTDRMLELFVLEKAQIIDIRFPEEYQAWHLDGSVNIPLNELPDRLGELDRKKLIITVCPHNDRANMGRLYLSLKGFEARYLTDGLLSTMSHLRGDAAKAFVEASTKEL